MPRPSPGLSRPSPGLSGREDTVPAVSVLAGPPAGPGAFGAATGRGAYSGAAVPATFGGLPAVGAPTLWGLSPSPGGPRDGRLRS